MKLRGKYSKGAAVVAAALFTVLGLTACPTGTPIEASDKPLFDNGVNVFEAQVVDAMNGTLLTGAQVFVHVGRHALDATEDSGFYTVYGIPRGTFRVTVTMTGYTPFRAMKSFNGNGRLSWGDPLSFEFNNILMYPEGSVPGDLIVSVYDGNTGAPVEGATVLASLVDVTPVIDISSPLAPNVGILPPTLAGATDAAGKAIFTAANLIMNGEYFIDVYGALDADGVYLVPVSNRSIIAGRQVQEVVVFLSRPALNPVALMANNEEDVTNTELVVTFPYEIELCTTDANDHGWNNSTSWHTAADTDGDGTVTSPSATAPVTSALEDGGTVLRLSFATENDDAGDALYVDFWGIRVKPAGASDGSCTSLGNVSLRGSGTVDTEIHVRNAP